MKFISICYISFMFLFFTSVLLFYLSLLLLNFDYSYFIEWEVITLGSLNIVMTLILDWMSLMFMSFVLLISSLVIYYSKDYMAEDNNINRFIILVLMFVCSMMLLIISPNLISILLGWDGLGLVSYCLVIYFQNVKSYNAGMLTALSNRLGDVAFLLAIAWMLNYGSWNYIYYLDMMNNDLEMLIIGGLIMLAAMTKSAQIPFSSWLPAAMAAPTPVSALVHSSTLVTAGVYLLIRFSNLLLSLPIMKCLLLISGLTMFMSGLGANYEFDLKKIIALSTLSQLGLMMSILSFGFMKLAFFHLLTHALFKALLFMCAGAIIHNMINNQDIRFMGCLSNLMPMTVMCMSVANLALCGMPFLAGFYSKDLILETIYFNNFNMLVFLLFIISTALTVMYSFRLIYYSLTGMNNVFSYHPMNDNSWVMLKSMVSLLIMAVIGGSLLMWLIFPSPEMICLPLKLKFLTLEVCILGGLLGYLISFVKLYFLNKALIYFKMSWFLGSMWFMPMLSTMGMIFYPLKLGYYLIKNLDQGWSEYFGGQNFYKNAIMGSSIIEQMQNNYLKIYLLLMFVWFLMFFLILLIMS
nr:NADH dehydrogenase subunit 5 [Phlebotomus sichuanensis]WPV76947.1 NADH dehydrogenase subunit 5 [Phlebotomus sichuanensis]WPV76960.1 NADH dehydrogenase subunit 5 [Phlebotomus sichuanensis]WPV76973.1 NADH dehydrogenase subunit 5 [Phlebotomus sichuanensis]WPV76986.1 NADH dehydrogenase subunit 5 [Phlebotomus sichuanensis]